MNEPIDVSNATITGSDAIAVAEILGTTLNCALCPAPPIQGPTWTRVSVADARILASNPVQAQRIWIDLPKFFAPRAPNDSLYGTHSTHDGWAVAGSEGNHWYPSVYLASVLDKLPVELATRTVVALCAADATQGVWKPLCYD